MASASEHYEKILSPVYAWMVGGVDAAQPERVAWCASPPAWPERDSP
jgi:hypothetical protein